MEEGLAVKSLEAYNEGRDHAEKEGSNVYDNKKGELMGKRRKG